MLLILYAIPTARSKMVRITKSWTNSSFSSSGPVGVPHTEMVGQLIDEHQGTHPRDHQGDARFHLDEADRDRAPSKEVINLPEVVGRSAVDHDNIASLPEDDGGEDDGGEDELGAKALRTRNGAGGTGRPVTQFGVFENDQRPLRKSKIIRQEKLSERFSISGFGPLVAIGGVAIAIGLLGAFTSVQPSARIPVRVRATRSPLPDYY